MPKAKSRRKTTKGFPKENPEHFDPAPGLKFIKGKFTGLNVISAISVLVDPAPSFYGHKAVLFDGLKAFLLNPKDKAGIRHAMASAVSGRIAKMEQSRTHPLGRAFPRADKKYSALYTRVYDHIGGMTAIRSAILNEARVEKARGLARKQIPHLVAMAAILDFHHRELSDDRKIYGSPSIQKAGEASLWLTMPERGKVRARATVWEYWSLRSKAVPLLYAASLVKIAPDQTLLDRLLDRNLSLQQAKPVLEKWFGYARYFTETTLKEVPLRIKLRKDGKQTSRFVLIEYVPAKDPGPYHFTEAMKDKLKEHFAERKPSQRRVRHS